MSAVVVRKSKGKGSIPPKVECSGCNHTVALSYGTSRGIGRTHKRQVTVAYECSRCNCQNTQLYVVDEEGRVIIALGSISPKEVIVI
jgi:hypothetical protein